MPTDTKVTDYISVQCDASERNGSLERSNNDHLLSRLATTIRAKEASDARYAQATLNLDTAESSNRALLRELQDARAVITRLSAHVARSAGWEEKIMALEEQRDDVTQERDAQAERAKVLEVKVSSLSEKCGGSYPEPFLQVLHSHYVQPI